MDIAIERYIHAIYWAHTKPLFEAYNAEVNGPDYAQDGFKLNEWAQDIGRIKVIRDLGSNRLIGFMAYWETEEKGTIFAEALYIEPEMRYNGLTRALLASFPGAHKVSFILHKSRSEGTGNPMLTGLLRARKVSDHPHKAHLEYWEFLLDHEREFNSNANMNQLRA